MNLLDEHNLRHRRVPLTLQSLRGECGLACLAMVLGYHSGQLDLAYLRRRYPGFERGASFKDLTALAREMGFFCRGVRTEPGRLSDLQQPAILHWRMDHFVVLVRVRRHGVVLHDPARGRVECAWSEVDECFTGVALEVWADESAAQLDTGDAGERGLGRIWQWVAGIRRQVVWVVLLSTALQLMVLAVPWQVQWTVDEALVGGDAPLISVLALAFLLLLICRTVTHWLRGAVVLHLGHLLSFQLATRLLRHLMQLPLNWFEQRHVGDIASRFASLQPLRELLTQGVAAMVVDALMVVLSLAFMLLYHPALAGLVVVTHMLYVLVQLGFVSRLKRFALGVVTAQAAEQSHLLQSVQSVVNLKVFNLEGTRLDQWQKLHSRTLEQSLGMQRQQLALASGGLLVHGAELIALIYFMAHAVLAGSFTLGMMFAFLSYRGHFAERLSAFTEQWVNLGAVQVHWRRVTEVLDETAQDAGPVADTRATPLLPVGTLQMQGVGWQVHAGQHWILQDVDLTVSEGEFVAVVGASGAGKSTLLKLLMGLLHPSAGTVSWADQPLTPARAQHLRRAAACVLQSDSLFSGSVLDNLVLFDVPDVARVQACLAEVDMSTAVAQLPLGWHTPVGDLGQGFSSGQLQRLLMARALYRQPRYLFLDEATANLDAHNACGIAELVAALHCTRVVVTHDATFAARADRIFALQGRGLVDVTEQFRSAAARSPAL